MSHEKEEGIEKGISPNYVPDKVKSTSKTKKKRKYPVTYLVLFVVALFMFGGIFISTKDDMTYELITNCEINIKKNLSSPSSFKPISVRMLDLGRTEETDTYTSKAMSDFSKELVRDKGYLAKSLFTTLEFDSKNKFNAEIRNIGVCEYVVLYKDNFMLTPDLVAVSIGGHTVLDKNSDHLHWIMTAEDISTSSSRLPIFMNKIKYLTIDVRELE